MLGSTASRISGSNPSFSTRKSPRRTSRPLATIFGLATVTYLFRGEFQHRDSLGSNQIILPGAVNWMVAGRGVTHSERTSAARAAPHSLFGIQTWVALPDEGRIWRVKQ